MRAPFLYVDAPLTGMDVGETLELSPSQQHHLSNVLRRRDGDPVVLADGAGRTVAALLASGGERDAIHAQVVEPVVVHDTPRPRVDVVHALPKGRGLDEVVRTLAELGVGRLDPVVTARTESRPSRQRGDRAAVRWQVIARSAGEQARSPTLCRVTAPRRLVPLDETVADDEVGIVAVPGAATTIGSALRDGGSCTRVRLVVGPEGGLTTDEVHDLERAGWVAARAGGTVLRSVHAGTVLVAATMALTGRFSGA